MLRARLIWIRGFLRILSIVIGVELGPKEIGSQFSEIALGSFLHFFLIKSDHVVGGSVSTALLSVE